MSTTDPLHDALEQLARHADHDPAPDRLAGITRRHRAQRNRRAAVGAGVATLAVVATGLAVGALPGVDDDPDRLAAAGVGLDVSLGIDAADPATDTYRVTYHVDGTALAVRDPATGDPIDHGGPLGTVVLLDGKNVGGSDGGAVECDPAGRTERYDQRFGPVEVTIPAGPHDVAVVVEYCGADGRRETARASERAEYLGTTRVVDRAREDLDGDGTVERIVLVDEGTDSSLRVSGSVGGNVSLGAADPVRISGIEDLDGDGRREVLVDVEEGELTRTLVLTVAGGEWRLDGTTLRSTPWATPHCGGPDVGPAGC